MNENNYDLAIQRDNWFASEEGKRCSDISTLPPSDPQYLRKRLERAYLAGASDWDKVRQDLCESLCEPFLKEPIE